MAAVTGVLGPLDGTALTARLSIVLIGTVIAALGAAVREAQFDRLQALDDAVALRVAFERALAPAPIAPPGFRAVSRYEPAEARMHLGGDFVEGVALTDGRFAVLIGDVCGHGPREAAFGSALRAGWKAIALGGGDPVEWVESLEAAFFRDGRIDTYATVCTGWMDRNANLTRLVTLGHPPPITVSGRPTVLDVAPAPPLGIGMHDRVVATDIRWTGCPLLFYSDGLIENPRRGGDRPERWGIDGLLGWLAAQQTHSDIDRVADDLVAAALQDREQRDDVAVLIVAGATS